MGDSAKVFFQDGEWWVAFEDAGKQHHLLAAGWIGEMALWLKQKDAEIERLRAELQDMAAGASEFQQQAMQAGDRVDEVEAENDRLRADLVAALVAEYAAREWAAGRYSDEQLRNQLAQEE